MSKHQTRAERLLRKWADFDPKRTHIVGYPSKSQSYRAWKEGPDGMLAKGPIGDGGMFDNVDKRGRSIDYLRDIHRMSAIVFRMRFAAPDYFEIVRVTYVESPPNRIKPRHMAAEELGWSETTYRRLHDRMLAYIEGAWDNAAVAA